MSEKLHPVFDRMVNEEELEENAQLIEKKLKQQHSRVRYEVMHCPCGCGAVIN